MVTKKKRLRGKTPKIDLITLNRPLTEVGLSISLLFSLEKLGIKNLIELWNELKDRNIKRNAIGERGWREINRIFKNINK